MVNQMGMILARESSDTWAEAWGQALTKLMSLAIEGVMQRKPVKNKDQILTR